jgi:hypothetical protein
LRSAAWSNWEGQRQARGVDLANRESQSSGRKFLRPRPQLDAI